jgi:purine-nucleoside phosphorylase
MVSKKKAASGASSRLDGESYSKATAAARYILSKTKLRPQIALVLGSGLGAFADDLANATKIPYARIPHFPRSTAIGHAGQLVIGKVAGVPVAVMQGRVHFYEGYSLKEVTFPMRVFGRMGIRAVILTCACAGLDKEQLKPGSLALFRDHINLQGSNPLVGPNESRFGARFPDMTRAYSQQFRNIAHSAAKEQGIELCDGVYVAVPGPSYETPAEIRFLRGIGADMVGMSTVPEAIVARHMGIDVMAIGCITNYGAGMLDQPINHEEVLEVGRQVYGKFSKLLRALIPRIAQTF